MSTTAEKIEVMQAFERGEAIECRQGFGWEGPVTSPSWDWSRIDYRIATKPKKTVDLYQWLCNDGHSYYISNHYELAPYNRIKRLDHTKMTIEVD